MLDEYYFLRNVEAVKDCLRHLKIKYVVGYTHHICCLQAAPEFIFQALNAFGWSNYREYSPSGQCMEIWYPENRIRFWVVKR